MAGRIVIGVLLIALAAAGVMVHRGGVAIPAHLNPWEELDVAATPNFLTRYKLGKLNGDGERCRAVLAATRMEFEPLEDRVTGEDCGFHDAVLVRRTPQEVGEAFSLSCRAAVSLVLWERHAVQPAAERHFGRRVSRFEHFGSYSCRNVYGRPQATRSRHATAEAWDVAGFVLDDGQRIRIAREWRQEGPEGSFLHEVRTGACRFFDGVLSPDYNAAHHDHLHLDRGTFRLCR